MFNFSPEVMQQIMQFVQQRFGPQAGQGFQQRFGEALSQPMGAPQPDVGAGGAPGTYPNGQPPMGIGMVQPPPGLSQPFGGPAQPTGQQGGFDGWGGQRAPGFGTRPPAQQGGFGGWSGQRAPGGTAPGQGFGSFGAGLRQQPAMGLGNLAPQPPSMPGIR
jgi:hypothetical protein